MNEERDEDNDEGEGKGGETENRAETDAFKKGRQQKASEETVDQEKRIFTIPKPTILSIRKGSHAYCMRQFVRNCRTIAYISKKPF